MRWGDTAGKLKRLSRSMARQPVASCSRRVRKASVWSVAGVSCFSVTASSRLMTCLTMKFESTGRELAGHAHKDSTSHGVPLIVDLSARSCLAGESNIHQASVLATSYSLSLHVRRTLPGRHEELEKLAPEKAPPACCIARMQARNSK